MTAIHTLSLIFQHLIENIVKKLHQIWESQRHLKLRQNKSFNQCLLTIYNVYIAILVVWIYINFVIFAL